MDEVAQTQEAMAAILADVEEQSARFKQRIAAAGALLLRLWNVGFMELRKVVRDAQFQLELSALQEAMVQALPAGDAGPVETAWRRISGRLPESLHTVSEAWMQEVLRAFAEARAICEEWGRLSLDASQRLEALGQDLHAKWQAKKAAQAGG